MQRFDSPEFDAELAFDLLLRGDHEGFKAMQKQYAPNLQHMISCHPSEMMPKDANDAATLLKTYAGAGKAGLTGRCALRMLELKIAPAATTFNQVLAACAQKKDLHMLWAWWGILMSAGYKFNLVSFNIFLNACARSRNEHQAECCIRAMRSHGKMPSLVGLSALIHCFAKAGKMDKALAWFKEVLALGIEPDVIAYNVMINAYAKAGDIRQALTFVASMWDRGLCPDTTTYNSFIDACAKFGDGGCIERLLMLMESNGIKPDSHTFCALIHLYSKQGDVERCEFWLNKMLKLGMVSNALCYNMVLHACAQRGDPRQAEAWLSYMESQGVPLDGVTYSSLLNAYCRARDWDGVVSCVLRRVRNGVSVDHMTLDLLMKYSAEGNHVVRQGHAWEAYSLVIRALLSVGDMKNVRSLLSDVPSRKIPEHAKAAHQFFRQLCMQTTSDAKLARVLYTKINDSPSVHCNTSNSRTSSIPDAKMKEACARFSKMLSEVDSSLSTSTRRDEEYLASHRTWGESTMWSHQYMYEDPRVAVLASSYAEPSFEVMDRQTTSRSTTATSTSPSDDGCSGQGQNPSRWESHTCYGEMIFL